MRVMGPQKNLMAWSILTLGLVFLITVISARTPTNFRTLQRIP